MPSIRTPMHEALRERTLIERARSGDQDAYGELVRANFPRVYALLARLVDGPEDAEDLAQDCFVRAWHALGHYRGECSFSSWLYKIAMRLALDHRRTRARRLAALPQVSEGWPVLEQASARGERPAEHFLARELSRALAAALQHLPQRLRTALVLRVFRDLEYEEIARVTGVAPATSRLHVLQARSLLLRRLAPWLGGKDQAGPRPDSQEGGA
jgi:RNA polymerase sigma-70 factor (ECF subfamily)